MNNEVWFAYDSNSTALLFKGRTAAIGWMTTQNASVGVSEAFEDHDGNLWFILNKGNPVLVKMRRVEVVAHE